MSRSMPGTVTRLRRLGDLRLDLLGALFVHIAKPREESGGRIGIELLLIGEHFHRAGEILPRAQQLRCATQADDCFVTEAGAHGAR